MCSCQWKKKGREWNMAEVLRAEQIEKYYGTKDNLKKALDGLSFQVEEGEFTSIMGASGSGGHVKIRLS